MSIYEEKKQRTKQLIQTTFMNLLAEKSFDSIAIGDITKKADINRGTFYLHYLDKFDLLEQMEEQLFSDLGNHIDKLQSHYLSAPTFEREQEQLASALFSFIEIHSPVLKAFLSDHGRAGFHIRFKNAFSEKVRLNLEQHGSFYETLNVPKDYFISFITSAFLGLVEQWIQNELDKTPDEMTACYIEIITFIQGK
ncbi:TetR/AcrR family transcriptional regulator C-terminal domain-containing protein [Paenibacillus sp. DXFW5]|uniref:TetR/AcrR family transcriptional regulator C-terminal domain-containing protein n=1 Tax=Paenibacillus rhizolycopersici TaxID=2780073 RepID=A0ABS2H557_9BACL|nr:MULTISPECIES: TetR/AcrR family transcriptional regulator C-terminal domain-containing protein [Paenibacillus]MBM6996592.1 TetR/AcrR family transcriptional regulator C-terminal domain-containing protein [Paenibacillus rhizolycopersici]GIP47851.1 TetR family transcriptional regulator [Paenibacillus sp. J53TS2]